MLTKYLAWMALTLLTGSPIVSAVLLIGAWLVADRFTFRVLPDPLRVMGRLARERQLARTVAANPHDRRSRLELAELRLERRAYESAVEVLRPAMEAGADDVQSIFVMGTACLGAGYVPQGEALLGAARDKDPDFRVGEIDLVRGRFRLRRGDFAGAKEALEALIHLRKGSVEGRVLLARAVSALGDQAAATRLRDEAWAEYLAAPGFQRRLARRWAWQARPSRPLLYGLGLLLVVATCVGLGGGGGDPSGPGLP